MTDKFAIEELIATRPGQDGKFVLEPLPYSADALEPALSTETLELHHGKHLAAYVANLNNLLPGSGYEGKSLEEIAATAQGGVLNNAGQILNHNIYFQQLQAPQAENKPTGRLLQLVEEQFGSFDDFKQKFNIAATTLFGSGWAWLATDKSGKLSILQTSNAGNPVAEGLRPLMCFDVWEHAYYVDYRNRRPEYIAAMWQIINWSVVESRL